LSNLDGYNPSDAIGALERQLKATAVLKRRATKTATPQRRFSEAELVSLARPELRAPLWLVYIHDVARGMVAAYKS
jgi:hypothetical protein